MQLPHRPPLTPEEKELVKARTRQANVMTWLSSLTIGTGLLLIGLPVCLMCMLCLFALVMSGVLAVSFPPVQ